MMQTKFVPVVIGLAATIILIEPFRLGPFERPEIIVSASISVLGTGFAAIFGYFLWLQQHRADLAKEEIRRAARRDRLLIALRAEVFQYAESQFEQFNAQSISDLRETLHKYLEEAKDGEHSMPMSVVVKESVVFGGMKPEILDLPPEVLSPLIKYHQFSENSAELLVALSDGKYENVSMERRRGVLEKLFVLGTASTNAAVAAFEALDQVIGMKNDEESQRIRDIAKAMKGGGA